MLPNTGLSIFLLGVKGEPTVASRQEIVYFLLVEESTQIAGFCHFRSEKNTVANHKLSVDVIGCRVIREFVPHWTHERFCCARHPLENSVQIVDECVSLVDWRSDCLLHALGLEPGLAVRRVDFSVSTEERIPSTKLVELDVEIVGRFSVEPRHIRSTIRMSTQTKLEQHVDGALKFIVECIVVTSPEGTEFLAAKEERPR